MTTEQEAAKRRELQLVLLREGDTQDEARKMAANWTMPEVTAALERMRENAMRFPEHQIVPPGTIDLEDMKGQREEVIAEAEEAKYFENRDALAALMAQSFSVPEMPTAVLQALAAMADIIETVEGLRRVYEHERAKVQS